MSGYDKALLELYSSDPDKLRGTILSEAGRDDLLPPALTMLIFPGEGNGIPERLWSRFESFGAARVAVGSAGMPSNQNESYQQTNTHVLPPRMASLAQSQSPTSISSTMSAYGNLSAHPSLTCGQSRGTLYGYSPNGVSSRHRQSSTDSTAQSIDDYFSLPRKTVRHSTSVASLGSVNEMQHGNRHAGSRGGMPSFGSRDPVPLPYPHQSHTRESQSASLRLQSIDPFYGDSVPAGYVRTSGYAEANADVDDKWYKTQICNICEELGRCKYGNTCRHAHGLGELRQSLPGGSIVPPPTPPPEPLIPARISVNQQTSNAHSFTTVHHTPPHAHALAHGVPVPVVSPARATSRLELRRASAPPVDLSTVDEHNEAAESWHSTRPMLTPDEFLPIGAERARNKSRRADQNTAYQSQSHSPAPAQARRNGRSPDLVTMAEWFSSHPRESSLPHSHSRPTNQAEPWPRVDSDAPSARHVHGNLTPRASTSSLSSSSGQLSHAQSIQSANYQIQSMRSVPSMSTSISSSLQTLQTLATPISTSLTSSWGLEVDVASSSAGSNSQGGNAGGSVPGSFGSAYGKKVESTLKSHKYDDNVELLPEEGALRSEGRSASGEGRQQAALGKGNLASTTWDFSTGQSIWC